MTTTTTATGFTDWSVPNLFNVYLLAVMICFMWFGFGHLIDFAQIAFAWTN